MRQAGRLVTRRGLLRHGVGALAVAALWAVPAAAEGSAVYHRLALKDLVGDSTSLAREAAGKKLVVVVMKGHWCPQCIKELQLLAGVQKELTELGAVVVGLNADPSRANAAVAQKYSLPFQLLSDPDHSTLEALGLWLPELEHPMPAIIVFDACGKEHSRRIGRGASGTSTQATLAELRKLQSNPCAPSA